MTSQIVALFAIVAATIGVTLGNYWFVYGLWPKSWGAFVLWGFISLFVHGLAQTISKEK